MVKKEWDADCEEYEAAFPGFKANWEANKKPRERHPVFYTLMAAKGQWDEAALPKPKLPNGRSSDADERRLAKRRSVSGSPGGAGSCGKQRGLLPTPSSPCMHLQTLMSKKEWDADCEQYEAAFPGFRANWEANDARRTALAAVPQESHPDFYARMAAKGQWDEAALPKPKLPQSSSADADERRLGNRRYVSGVPRGLLGAVEAARAASHPAKSPYAFADPAEEEGVGRRLRGVQGRLPGL